MFHDDAIKWKHFPRYWPFVRGIHRSPVNSPHNDQRRRVRTHYDVIVISNNFLKQLLCYNKPLGIIETYIGLSPKGLLETISQKHSMQNIL